MCMWLCFNCCSEAGGDPLPIKSGDLPVSHSQSLVDVLICVIQCCIDINGDIMILLEGQPLAQEERW